MGVLDEDLNEQLFWSICRFLQASEIVNCGLSCRNLHGIVDGDNEEWEGVFAREFGQFGHESVQDRPWKDQCLQWMQFEDRLDKRPKGKWKNLEQFHPQDRNMMMMLIRQGTAVARCGDSKKLLLMGGWTHIGGIMNDLILFDFEAKQWISLIPMDTDTRVRRRTYGHVLTYVSSQIEEHDGTMTHNFICTGGVRRGGYVDPSRTILEISVMDNMFGKMAEVEPELPGTPRSYHTASAVFDSQDIVIFGGFDDYGVLSGLERYNVPQQEFHTLTASSTGPCARFGHSCTRLASTCTMETEELLIAGGSVANNNMKGHGFMRQDELSDMYTLTISKKDNWRCHWTKIVGGIPDARFLQRLHSATAIGKDRILFFGGGSTGNTINDAGIFNSKTCKFVPVSLKAEENDSNQDEQVHAPDPRQNHFAFWLGGSEVVIYGGCRALPIRVEELNDTWVLDLH